LFKVFKILTRQTNTGCVLWRGHEKDGYLYKLSRDAQEEIRRQAMRLREELALTWKEIARVTGASIGVVPAWSKCYESRGSEGLESQKSGRRAYSVRTLSLVQEYPLRQILEGENPKQMKLAFALWNRRAVMELIEQSFGVKTPTRTAWEYLRRWGDTPQRPMKRALEQNPKQVKVWREECYPGITAPRRKTWRFTGRTKRRLPWRGAGFGVTRLREKHQR
jgi:transposase